MDGFWVEKVDLKGLCGLDRSFFKILFGFYLSIYLSEYYGL